MGLYRTLIKQKKTIVVKYTYRCFGILGVSNNRSYICLLNMTLTFECGRYLSLSTMQYIIT
jgi:hypothetical protein